MIKPDFMEQVFDILDESLYDNDALKWIVKQCKEYFNEYKKPITLDVFKVKTSEVQGDILKTTIIETLKEVYRYLDAPDLDYIQDMALDFFKNQMLKNAIVESVEILEGDGDFDAIKTIIDNAMRAGAERNVGHEYAEEVAIEQRYSYRCECGRRGLPIEFSSHGKYNSSISNGRCDCCSTIGKKRVLH